MWLWIVAIVIVGIGYLVYVCVRRVLDKRYALKDPTLETPLTEFKESCAIDTRLAHAPLSVTSNISEAYERMCVVHPLEYKDDPSVPGVIAQYKKLLSGELQDPEGRHVPSEYLLDHRNLDYETYILAQKKALGKDGRLCKEAKRLKAVNEEEDLRTDFTVKLIDMGFPAEVLDAVMSDEKLNTFKAADWKKLTGAVKEYLSEYDVEIVTEYLETFHDIKTLANGDKMEAYATYRKYSVPIEVVVEIVRGRITVEQASRIIKLAIDEDYQWEQAVTEVLQEDADRSAEKDLRDRYRQMVRE
jgi:hypothetical protein